MAGEQNSAQTAAPSSRVMISVVIPTYNRAGRLQNLLESVERMRRPAGLAWEAVVVDNNSNDTTRDVVLRFAEGATVPVRYVFEARQGNAHARNRGVAEARGEVIACVDDDCIVHETWLSAISDEFARDERLLLLGGRVELFDSADAPMTIRTGRVRLDLTGNPAAIHHLIGCNLAFRRDAYERAGGFDPRYGAGGGGMPSNEDTEFNYRVLRLGGTVLYAPEAIVYHHHGRQDPQVLAALQKTYATGRGGFYADYIRRADLRIARMAAKELIERLAAIMAPRTSAARRAEQVLVLRALWHGAAMMMRHSARR